MILLVDIGNTAVKFASVELVDVDAEITPLAVIGRERGIELSGELRHIANLGYSEVLVSSVATKRFERELDAKIEKAFGLTPIYARTDSHCAGVHCAYEDPKRLGVDRWLAVLAGWYLSKGKPVVVVDCGTAVTLDVVVAGEHLGGLIVPGVNTMMKSLFRDTDQIAGAAAGEVVLGQLPMLGLNTRDAVAAGSRHMVLGFLDRHRELLRERYGDELVSIVGGGSAVTMLDAVNQKWDYERHLVWRGLMIWASNRDLMAQVSKC